MTEREKIYHGSTSLFERFSLSGSGRGAYASNGGLGIWVTPEIKIASAFGGDGAGFIYELAPPPGEILQVPLRWLIDRHQEAAGLEETGGREAAVAFYDDIRRKMLAQGYGQLWIMEQDDTAPTRVYLDPDQVEILSVTEFCKNAKMVDETPEQEPSF